MGPLILLALTTLLTSNYHPNSHCQPLHSCSRPLALMQATTLLQITIWVDLKQTPKLLFPPRTSPSLHHPSLLTFSSNFPMPAYHHRHLHTFLPSQSRIWAFRSSLRISLRRIRFYTNQPSLKRPLLTPLMHMTRDFHNSRSIVQGLDPIFIYEKKTR